MSLSLNYFILGDDPTRMSTVKILKTDNVAILRTLIKNDRHPRFADVPVDSFELWKVSFPLDNLATELKDVDVNKWIPLSPTYKKMSLFFTGDIQDDHLHVVVKIPPVIQADSSPELFSLNYFVLGDDPTLMSTVKIPKTDNVAVLRTLIKNDRHPRFADVPIDNFELWKVSFPVDKLSSQTPPPLGPKMGLLRPLNELFPVSPDVNLINIFVRVQGIAPTTRPPPSAYKPIAPIDELATERKNFCYNRVPAAPSGGAQPKTFFDNQLNNLTRIPCNRPNKSPNELPVTLLHPVFGQFVDDCKNYVPTAADFAFAHDFAKITTDIYPLEKDRHAKILEVFREHGIHIVPSKIDNYTTDGDMLVDGYRYLIAEIKNEIGSTGAEPYFQAVLYYLEATRIFASQLSNSVLPCIIVLVFGPYIAFAGATWTDRPNIQILSTAIPCHYHSADVDVELSLVRHLAALRRATDSLFEYYHNMRAQPTASQQSRNPRLPYPTSFKSLDGSVKDFKYHSHMTGRNLYFGTMDGDNDGSAICVKFVTRYCEEAHELLASKGFAPNLHTVERLPGGWYMIVMQDLSKEGYVSLFDYIQDNPGSLENMDARDSLSRRIKDCLSQLHEAGFVHGDVRNTNIMVKTGGFDDGSFQMVDYDYSGEIGQVRYPLDLNTSSVRRPEGATGGSVIEMDHDLDMLDGIWNLSPFPLSL